MCKKIVTVVLALGLTAPASCGAPEASIKTSVEEGFKATTLSILSQVKWEQVMTHLQGKVGPDFEVWAEGYISQTAGIHFRVRGGEISIDTQASGTGGQDNSTLASWPEIIKVASRWENSADSHTANKDQLAKDLANAIIEHWKNNPTTQPASK